MYVPPSRPHLGHCSRHVGIHYGWSMKRSGLKRRGTVHHKCLQAGLSSVLVSVLGSMWQCCAFCHMIPGGNGIGGNGIGGKASWARPPLAGVTEFVRVESNSEPYVIISECHPDFKFSHPLNQVLDFFYSILNMGKIPQTWLSIYTLNSLKLKSSHMLGSRNHDRGFFL